MEGPHPDVLTGRYMPVDRPHGRGNLLAVDKEARHHSAYVKLANDYAPEEVVRARLAELAAAEAAIVEQGEDLPRMHS